MPQPQPDYQVHLECLTSGPTGGKFWIATVDGRKALVRWGPCSKTGQAKEYEFGSTFAALRFVQDKEEEKRAKGYYQVSQQRVSDDPQKTRPKGPEPVQSITVVSNEALSWDF